MAWQVGKLAELENGSQQNLVSNHHGHPVKSKEQFEIVFVRNAIRIRRSRSSDHREISRDLQFRFGDRRQKNQTGFALARAVSKLSIQRQETEGSDIRFSYVFFARKKSQERLTKLQEDASATESGFGALRALVAGLGRNSMPIVIG